jgi:hypothetical protein
MPAETPIKDKDLFPQYAYHSIAVALPGTRYTTTTKRQPYIAWNANTGDLRKSSMDDNTYMHSSFNNNRQFIQMEQTFLKQLQQSAGFFEGHNTFFLKEKMKMSADALLNYSPDKISLQLTNEGSIFYTLFKDGLTIYLQHYITDDHDDTDEAIISVFKGDENRLNFGGSLTDTLSMANSVLSPESIQVLELA